MFISEAWAQAAGGGGGMGGLDSIQGLLPFILIFVVFYFFMIRPQQAKAKKHKELVKNLRRGDRVLTQSGMFATVAKVINDAEVQVEIAEGVRVRLLRSSVTDVLAKTEPLSKDKTKDAKSSDDGTSDATDADQDAAEEQAAPPPAPPAPQGIAGVLAKLLGGK